MPETTPAEADKKPKFKLTPLADEPRSALPTAEAAQHLDFLEQTLRKWACKGTGPIKPVRVAGRLRWPVADLRRVLEAQQ